MTENSRTKISQESTYPSSADVSTNCSPIVDDGFPDEVATYNKELEDLGNPSWLDVPWLFSECYMYR